MFAECPFLVEKGRVGDFSVSFFCLWFFTVEFVTLLLVTLQNPESASRITPPDLAGSQGISMHEPLQKFNEWARSYPVATLAEELKHTGPAIYAWLTGRACPRMDTAWKIVALSKGALTLQDIRPDTLPPQQQETP